MAIDPAKVRSIFIQAIECHSPEERNGYLEMACGGDVELRCRAEALLRAHEGEDAILDQGLLKPDLVESNRHPPKVTEAPGTLIGPYKLLEQIGEGGFGVVFLAEQQQPVRRKVALKIVKPGMDSKQVIARFEAERQALALMDHPNIAKVLEAGATDTGRPYFVMELVRGVPITDFCDHNQLPVRERLEVFLAVCQAVHHAHQKGIIHRDLKPSNVLVTLQDGIAVVKVIDFGIAKALGHERLTDKTLFTGFAHMLGTPLYMSPEQAEMSGQDTDTRTDIYSLGVLLYELLTGTTPFDKEHLKQASYDEMRRIIREEEPAKPSTRISTLGQAATTLSANRQSEPRRLSQLFRGELDWIVMKALEKDRDRRYETASALAADVQRYLQDEPVQACPPSAVYRFRKFARRNKAVLMTASAVAFTVLLAVVGLAVSTALIWQAKGELETNLYFHRIALAHRELTASPPNPGRAEELLDACPPSRRRWEWHYLKRLGRTEPLVLRDPGNQVFNSVAFSSDGAQIAAACGDGTIAVWDLQTGQVVTLRGHKDYVYSVAFSPTDSRRLASAGHDQTVRVWDLTTRQEVFQRPGCEGRTFGVAYSVTFSPDGRWLAAASEDRTVRVWDATTGQLIHELPDHEIRANCVAFSPDGRLLASGSWRGIVRIWDARTGRCLYRFAGHTEPLSSLAFSPNGQQLAVGCLDRLIDIWDMATAKRLRTLAGHREAVVGLAFSPDGRLASASLDRTVRLWDLSTGQEVLQLPGHTDICQCLTFSPDCWRLASASPDRTIRMWDATPLTGNEGQEALTFAEHTDEVRSVAISPDGRRIASAGRDPTVRVWETATGQVWQTFSDFTLLVFSLAFSPDGRYLAAAGVDNAESKPFMLKVWDSQTGQPVLTFREQRAIDSIGFSPDRQSLALRLMSGTVKLVDLKTGRMVVVNGKHGREVEIGAGVAFRPDGRRLASVGGEGTIKVWDVTPSLQPAEGCRAWLPVLSLLSQAGCSAPLPLASVVQMELSSTLGRSPTVLLSRNSGVPLYSVAYSPDGHRLVTGSNDGQLTLWETETRQEIRGARGPLGGEVWAVAISPDGRWVFSAGGDSTVRVWDATTLELIHTFRGHRGPVRCLAISRDGKFLVTSSSDKTVKVWDLTRLGRKQKSGVRSQTNS
jgi:WD40 repeat protein/serine/threonine protein kinase